MSTYRKIINEEFKDNFGVPLIWSVTDVITEPHRKSFNFYSWQATLMTSFAALFIKFISYTSYEC